jgi:hypothetical protein
MFKNLRNNATTVDAGPRLPMVDTRDRANRVSESEARSMSTKLIFNVGSESAWPRFHDKLASRGCAEDDIQFVWNEIAAHKKGEREVRSRTTPDPPFRRYIGSLNPNDYPKARLKPGDIVVGWQYNEIFVPGLVSMTIYE